MSEQNDQIMVGLDIGSTTVKAVAVRQSTDQMIWQDYQRHETKQPEKSLEFLKRLEEDIGITPENCRVFVTGSGGGGVATQIGGKFVQEGTAGSLAVEKMHPEVYSVSSWVGRMRRSSCSRTMTRADGKRRFRP